MVEIDALVDHPVASEPEAPRLSDPGGDAEMIPAEMPPHAGDNAINGSALVADRSLLPEAGEELEGEAWGGDGMPSIDALADHPAVSEPDASVLSDPEDDTEIIPAEAPQHVADSAINNPPFIADYPPPPEEEAAGEAGVSSGMPPPDIAAESCAPMHALQEGAEANIQPSLVYRDINSLAVASLTSEQATLSRRIGCGCMILVPQAGSGAALALYMTEEPDAEWNDPVVFSGPFGAIEVEQGTRFIRGLCGIDLSSVQLTHEETYGWLHAAVLGRLHGTPFGSAERIARTGEIATDAVVLRIVLRTDNHAFSVHARGSASAWLDLLSRVEWVREKRRHPLIPALPLLLPVTLARHTLPAAELRGLRIGDVILPSIPRFTCDANGVMSLGGGVMRVRYLAPCSLEILKMEDKLDDQYMEDLDGNDAIAEEADPADDYEDNVRYAAGDETEADQDEQNEWNDQDEQGEQDELDKQDEQGRQTVAAGETGKDKVGQVPVTLDFTLGHVRLTLGDLDTLGPGSVLTLEDGSPASVSITSSGQVLGRGEAVDVNGKLGIRIMQWG